MIKSRRRKKRNRRKKRKTRRKRGGAKPSKEQSVKWAEIAEKKIKTMLGEPWKSSDWKDLTEQQRRRYLLLCDRYIKHFAMQAGYKGDEIDEATMWFLAKKDSELIVAAAVEAEASAAKNIEHEEREDVYRGHLHKLGVKTGEKLYQNKNPTGGRRRRKTRKGAGSAARRKRKRLRKKQSKAESARARVAARARARLEQQAVENLNTFLENHQDFAW